MPPPTTHGLGKSTRTDPEGNPPRSPTPPTSSPSSPSFPQERVLTENERKAEELVLNILTMRSRLMSALVDPRRNINDECGYPSAVDPYQYQDAYDRQPISARVVECLPKETWQVFPCVYEDENAETKTAFEQAWDALNRRLRGEKSWYQDEEGGSVWEYLVRGDILSGVGRYGVLMIGFADGLPLEQPVAGVEESNSVPATRNENGALVPKDENWRDTLIGNGMYRLAVNRNVRNFKSSDGKPTGGGGPDVVFLRVFPESQAAITTWEYNPSSPRYGKPLMYSLTFGSSGSQQETGGSTPVASTMEVHWTRVVHLADVGHHADSSEVFAAPRMQPVFNNLLNIHKIQGAAAEGYWKSCFTGLSLETNPQAGGDVQVNVPKLKDMMESYGNGQQKWIQLTNMSAKTLAPMVVDPTPHVKGQIEVICIKLGIPIRVFMGSERGELASSQDDGAWNDRLRHRQSSYVTPRIIVPFVDRLIMVGSLPEPKGYSVKWPDLESQTQAEKSTVALNMTQALAAYVASGAQTMITPMDYLTRVWDMSEEEANAVLENAVAATSDTESVPTPLGGTPAGLDEFLKLWSMARGGGASEDQLGEFLRTFFGFSEEQVQKIMKDGIPEPPPMPVPAAPGGKTPPGAPPKPGSPPPAPPPTTPK